MAAPLPPPFRPAWWLPGAHAQTIGGRLLRRRSGVALERERCILPDGDFVDLDWARAPSAAPRAPLVLVLHGLEGSARSGYAFELYRCLHAAGADAVGLSFRSCSGEPNRGRRLYHSGETGDLEHVLAQLGGRHADRPIAAVGVSLGGNVLLKHLGERGVTTPLAAAAAISVPYDLAAGARHMERGFARVYVRFLLRSLRRKLRRRAAELGSYCDLERAVAARTFWEFDDAATAPLHGFAGADDYYRRSSCGPLLAGVRVPTLLLGARDDPFVPRRAIPTAAIAANPYLQDATSEHGGHVGFVAGALPLRPVLWAEAAAARFVVHSSGEATAAGPVVGGRARLR